MPNNNDMPLWVDLKERRTSATDLLSYLGIDSPPIDMEFIVERLSVDLRRAELDYDGELRMDVRSGHAEIVVNKRATKNRERFTIAHELGHLMRHHFKTVHRDATGEYQGSIEYQANAYAAELLMPAWMVRAFVRENPDMDSIRLSDWLSRVFEVSVTAMEYRLKNLDLI